MKYIALLGIILVFSCSKDVFKKTIIEGQVIDIVTNEPIQDLKINVREYDYSISGTADSRNIATLITDENGNFNYEFSAEKTKSYKCRIDLFTPHLSRGFRTLSNVSEDIRTREKNIIDFQTTFGGYIKEYYTNIDCDPSIVLEVDRQHEIPDAIRNLTFTLENCQTLSTDDFVITPQGLYTYTWRTLRNGEVLTENRDSFYLEIGERKEFTIEW